MTTKKTQEVIFNGLFTVGSDAFGHAINIGHQFITRPFVSDNPAHTHNFQEYLAWYGSNPDDPSEFEAKIHLYFGPEQELHVITQPTVVWFPPGLVHCPLEIVHVDKPIIQLEIMIPPLDGAEPTREPYFAKDADFTTEGTVDFEVFPL
jgi:hypothetical protein